MRLTQSAESRLLHKNTVPVQYGVTGQNRFSATGNQRGTWVCSRHLADWPALVGWRAIRKLNRSSYASQPSTSFWMRTGARYAIRWNAPRTGILLFPSRKRHPAVHSARWRPPLV